MSIEVEWIEPNPQAVKVNVTQREGRGNTYVQNTYVQSRGRC